MNKPKIFEFSGSEMYTIFSEAHTSLSCIHSKINYNTRIQKLREQVGKAVPKSNETIVATSTQFFHVTEFL